MSDSPCSQVPCRPNITIRVDDENDCVIISTDLPSEVRIPTDRLSDLLTTLVKVAQDLDAEHRQGQP